MRVITDLTEQVKNLQNNKHRNGNDNGNSNEGNGAKWVNGKHIWDKGHYCWSHGFLVRAEHTSATCNKQKRDTRSGQREKTSWEDVHSEKLESDRGGRRLE